MLGGAVAGRIVLTAACGGCSLRDLSSEGAALRPSPALSMCFLWGGPGAGFCTHPPHL